MIRLDIIMRLFVKWQLTVKIKLDNWYKSLYFWTFRISMSIRPNHKFIARCYDIIRCSSWPGRSVPFFMDSDSQRLSSRENVTSFSILTKYFTSSARWAPSTKCGVKLWFPLDTFQRRIMWKGAGNLIKYTYPLLLLGVMGDFHYFKGQPHHDPSVFTFKWSLGLYFIGLLW